jgi:hypothetical protein
MGLCQRLCAGMERDAWTARSGALPNSVWPALGISLALRAAACGGAQTQAPSAAYSAGGAAVAPSVV